MRNHSIAQALSLLCAAALVSGCASRSDHLVFVTKTSLGIDVEPSTRSAGLAYDRVEGFSSPMYESGVAPPVLASFESDGASLINPNVKQMYATGTAARKLATPSQAVVATPAVRTVQFQKAAFAPVQEPPAAPLAAAAPTGKPMFFGTGTVIGLKVGVSPTAMDGFTFGYKRKEVSVIPREHDRNDLTSVLAGIESGVTPPAVGAGGAPAPGDANADIRQFFATGDAAENLADDERVNRLFRDKAHDIFASYFEHQRKNNEAALASLSCVLRVDDARLKLVWNDAEFQQLFEKAGVIAALKADDAQAARARYANELFLLNHNSPALTARLREHKAYACGLASK